MAITVTIRRIGSNREVNRGNYPRDRIRHSGHFVPGQTTSLTKILQPLIKSGIVGSQRGVGGGFFLEKDPTEVTLLDVVKAEEGPLYLNQCLTHEGACERDLFCPVHGAWSEVRAEMLAILGRYTFAQLVHQEEQNLSGIASPAKRLSPGIDPT
jgi:Rrf2 family protein